MPKVAKGTFSVELKPISQPDTSEGISLGHLSLGKRFDGDLIATSLGDMLTAMTAVQGSAGYVAIERVSGTLGGRSGSFVFQHAGVMNKGSQQLTITVVPDSGTGELAGLMGAFSISVTEGLHFYEFEYSLPAE